MRAETLQEIVDSAILSGTVEVECVECGLSIICETDAATTWCDVCSKVVRVRNPLIELGFA
jgi:hypothetical protein